ncbi:MAG TPA: trehalose-6-phosphate synthase [Candidatus Peribacter riflensis]|nr:trehalose-6-phosphate synthase [Candidatus Peribacter riflensis]HBU09997.1 trehalose-6-phosphate synthase [Candidatus Peribacter riflensis]
MRLSLRFLIPLFIVLGLVAYAVVPLVDVLMTQWSVKDLDLRSKAIASASETSLFDGANNYSVPKARMQLILDRLMEDERLYALGFCNDRQALTYRTEKLPGEVTCQDVTQEQSTFKSEVLQLSKGPLHVSYYPLRGSGGVMVGEMILVHDMSFVSTRSASTKQYILYFMLFMGAIVSVITVVVAQLSWRGWLSGTRALLHGEGLLRPLSSGAAPELRPIARDLRNLVRNLESERRFRDDSQMDWTPRTLKELLHKELAGDEVIVVANREPYIHIRDGQKIEVQTPASGVVTALEPIMRACSGVWIAHGSGAADREVVDALDHIQVPPDHPKYTLRRIWLSEKEENGYYYGFANEGIWPLCHIAHVRPIFRSKDWETYQEVNEKFARAVVEEAKTEDPVILIQDYHFALLPRLLHTRLPKATIIMFWHIPWPNPEAFGICPWTKEILNGLLGSSILGFHTRFHVNNFLDTVEQFLECRIDREHSTISFSGERTTVNRYPISIEFPGRLLRQSKSIEDARKAIRVRYDLPADRMLGIGVDRFDYTKGISEKLLAVERLLELHPEWIGRFTFLQVAAPSRTRIDQYQRFQLEVREIRDRINQRFRQGNYEPIILQTSHYEPADVLGLYRAADLCFVGSLHDGMNLVAKEFVAARDDEQGVLILSKFTGASRDLPEALLVNPYHTDECAEALHDGLTMPPAEQKDRMRNMRAILHDFNIYRWAGRILIDAARTRARNRFLARVAMYDLLSSS